MILIHKESGEIFELLLMSVDDTELTYTATSRPAFSIGEFTLYSPISAPKQGMISSLGVDFEIIGMV